MKSVGGTWIGTGGTKLRSQWLGCLREKQDVYVFNSAAPIGAPTTFGTFLKDNTISTKMQAEIMRSRRLTVLVRVPEREGVHGYHFSFFFFRSIGYHFSYFLLVQEIFEDVFDVFRFGT